VFPRWAKTDAFANCVASKRIMDAEHYQRNAQHEQQQEKGVYQSLVQINLLIAAAEFNKSGLAGNCEKAQ